MYGIQKVAQLTDLSPITLRAWEQRYGVIVPERTDGGTRIYSDQDLADLQFVIDQKQQNQLTVKQAMGLLKEKKEASFKYSLDDFDITSLIKEVYHLLIQYKSDEASSLIYDLIQSGEEQVIFCDILLPVLKKVGDNWQNGTLTVAQEHFISQYVQQQIAQHFYQYQLSNPQSAALSICPPNEMHQIGLLLFSLFLKKQDIDVKFIGENTPVDSIDAMIEDLSVEYICCSVTLSSNLSAVIELIETITTRYPTIKIIIGGQSATQLPKKYHHLIFPNDYKAWQTWFDQCKNA
ncbi:B12 binding domain-containing protein [Pelagirhabdus alkalitolerans]|uniref:B12 binding domain-containing protein n=1 Tax=Pelagirhabdus alkalitolerans TaxID=1612202 RepID=A0A1G6JNA8_9BACI|nr:cobalamin-dependent protein [Pelagirhabdus alkalitolerans]SDC20193.1 B12 binding domain-containing protein [Pelagirhabdus alkalitolerans]